MNVAMYVSKSLSSGNRSEVFRMKLTAMSLSVFTSLGV